MYAIRSYYDRFVDLIRYGQDVMLLDEVDQHPVLGIAEHAARRVIRRRITSYNVCYTKLLRFLYGCHL